jgi:hypothetical protein
MRSETLLGRTAARRRSHDGGEERFDSGICWGLSGRFLFWFACSERGEEVGEGLLVEFEGRGFVGEEGFDEGGFVLLEFEDAVFDGAAADEFVDEDGFGLADAVGAVGGLVFGGGVPPGVVVDDGVCGG